MSGLRGWSRPDSHGSAARLCIEPPTADEPSRGPVASPIVPCTTIATDAGCTLGLHGEVHGLDRLRLELGLPAHASPAATALASWRRWSSGFVSRLDGVFALALCSGDEVLLYRDPSALQPLYWCCPSPRELVFATQTDTLLRTVEAARRIARRSLHEYLRFLDVAAPNTFFEGMFAVEAGCLLRWTPRGMESVASAVATAPAEAKATDFAGAVDTLRALLQQGVQRRLDDAARPAAFLSGGIDSSLVCALAHGHRADAVALTVGFAGSRYDESPLASQIAAHLGMPHRVLRFEHAAYLSALDRLSDGLDQPMADPATPATLLAFERCRENFDVVLDGTGADEAVGAMPPRHLRVAVGYGSLLPGALRRGLLRGMRAVPRAADYAPILDFEHAAETMIRWHGFTRAEIERLCGEPVSFEHTQFFRTFARFPRAAHFERYSALLDAMPCDRLGQSARITGMRVRYPFHDLHTNRFLRQLRTDWRWLPGQPKRILRALLASCVPMQIWDLPKHGFDFPLQQFLAAEDHALVRRYVIDGAWLDQGLLQAAEVRSYGQRFMAGDRRLMFRVWALVVLGAWLEKHDGLH